MFDEQLTTYTVKEDKQQLWTERLGTALDFYAFSDTKKGRFFLKRFMKSPFPHLTLTGEKRSGYTDHQMGLGGEDPFKISLLKPR